MMFGFYLLLENVHSLSDFKLKKIPAPPIDTFLKGLML